PRSRALLLALLAALPLLVACGGETPTTSPVAAATPTMFLDQTPVVRGATVVVGTLYPQTPSDAPTQTASTTGSSIPPKAAPAVASALAALASRLQVDVGTIQVSGVEAIDWPNSALGCPQEGHVYSQVVTPGYKIHLTAGGKSYTYHGSQLSSQVVTCTPSDT
ncbi:MAG TPA: hypothetical protein VM536_10405, partial [Chloroflexia bacterium]|nr:hypothetical protein [Chloroflexia bacterium]